MRPLGRVLKRRAIGPFVFVEHEYPARAERGAHSHPWLHLSIVQRGRYTRSLGSREWCYRPGSVALLPTHQLHRDSYAPGTRALHLAVPAVMEESLLHDFRRLGGAPESLAPPVAAQSAVALTREFRAPDSTSSLVLESLLTDLAGRALNLAIERSAHRPSWLRTVLECLDDTFDQPWTLGAIAVRIDVHPAYLCRAFSTHLHCTIGEYIRALRVQRGWELLQVSGATIAEIASQSGFVDQSHFTRAFKQRYGVTPGRYRRALS